MAWIVELHPAAEEQLAKLVRKDRVMAERITATLREVQQSGQPRSRGKGLTGQLAGLWANRVGTWRIIADIQATRCVVLALDMGQRSVIYQR